MSLSKVNIAALLGFKETQRNKWHLPENDEILPQKPTCQISKETNNAVYFHTWPSSWKSITGRRNTMRKII